MDLYNYVLYQQRNYRELDVICIDVSQARDSIYIVESDSVLVYSLRIF